jgi:hypothetical protein
VFQFGIGGMFAVPSGGNLATPSNPQRFGTIQDVAVEFDQKLVELMGQNKLPDDVAPSDMKITGKGGFGNIEIDIYNSLFFADAITAGSSQVSMDEAYTIASASAPAAWAATTTYTLGQAVTGDSVIQVCTVAGTSGASAPSWATTTGAVTDDGSTVQWTCAGFTNAQFVKVANAGTFGENLFVRYANGTPLSPTVGNVAPVAAGTYQVGAGVYGFYTSDVGQSILISYDYVTPSAAPNQGKTLTVNNHIQGYGPTFELFLVMPYMGNNCLRLHKCRSSKMSTPLKRDGYVISDFEFQAYPDANGVAFNWYQLGN